MLLPADTPIGIIAGGGVLPKIVYDRCRDGGLDPHIVALKGHADDAALLAEAGLTARPEKLGRMFKYLRKQKIRELVLIGRVRRPSLPELRPDWKTVSLLPKIAPVLRGGGDDALLRTIRKVLEGEGFRLHGVQDFIHDMTAPEGVMGQFAPDDAQMADIARGMDAARAIGALDIGQSVVVQQGVVLGVEGVEGTDALIARCARLARSGPAPVLCKSVKPDQDRQLDLPTVGPDTLKNCIDAGFAGVAVSAGSTLMVELGTLVEQANNKSIFLYGAA